MKLEVYDNGVLRKTEYSIGTEGFTKIYDTIKDWDVLEGMPLVLGEGDNGEYAAYYKNSDSKYIKNLNTVSGSPELGDFFSIKFRENGNNLRVKVYHYGNPRSIDIEQNIVLTGMYDNSDETTIYFANNNAPMDSSQVLQHISSMPFTGITVDSNGNEVRRSEYWQKDSTI